MQNLSLRTLDFMNILYYNINIKSVVFAAKGAFVKKYIDVLKKTKLFSGVGEEEIEAMLGKEQKVCSQAWTYFKQNNKG